MPSPVGEAILIWSCNDIAASHFDSDLGCVRIGAMRCKSSFKLGPYHQKAKELGVRKLNPMGLELVAADSPGELEYCGQEGK